MHAWAYIKPGRASPEYKAIPPELHSLDASYREKPVFSLCTPYAPYCVQWASDSIRCRCSLYSHTVETQDILNGWIQGSLYSHTAETQDIPTQWVDSRLCSSGGIAL